MKQTAVEWLIEQIKKEHPFWTSIFEQAKQMEKMQIVDAYEQGDEDGYWHPENGFDKKFESSEDYYNETFKK